MKPAHLRVRCLGGCGRLMASGSWCSECWATRAAKSYGHNQAFRAAVLAKDGYRCVECGEGDLSRLEAHHTEPGNDSPSTGVTLCRACHGERIGRYGG